MHRFSHSPLFGRAIIWLDQYYHILP
jgi:hypothetical protein